MDKGQAALLSAFGDAILTGRPSPSDVDNALQVSMITFGALELLRTHQVIALDEFSTTRKERAL